jgi:hypothetical protein
MIKPVVCGRAGQNNIDGILRPTMPLVGQAKGKRRFLNVTIPQEIKEVRNIEVITSTLGGAADTS